MTSILKVDTIQDQDGNNIINENAGTITIGKSGDTVQVAAGAEFVGGGTQWQSSIVTGTTLSAVAGNGYWIDTTSNACTVTLPASASVGDTIEFADYARTWQTNNVTINTNSLNYQGNTSPNPTLSTEGQHLKIVYSGATNGWIPTNDDPVALGTPQTYNAEYLVIAGGASGGLGNAGGGGAGGLLTNYGGSAITLSPGTTYTVTVGAGGGARTSSNAGSDGSDSVLSGTGISTITAIGGGGGGLSDNVAGRDGGSGGGSRTTGGSGTPGQGNDGGGASDGPPQYGAGGGGGAGAVGGQGSGNAAGNGGNGLSNSITGSAVTYAGGGGGSADINNAAAGSGGTGGGGNGTRDGTAGDGTNGLGGGGGGVGPGTESGAGGSGVVILRVPTASYSGTTTGSPTVTTDGTDTIMTFTGSGSYTG